MKRARLALAAALAAGLSACSGPESPVLPPSFDTHTLGSGGREGAPPPAEPGETTQDDSGHTLGSGG
jgi:hypothetical protein